MIYTPASFAATTPALACTQKPTGIAATPNAEWLIKRLVGRWLLCSSESFFGTSDEVGLEFTADGFWYKLYAGKNGQIVRGSGMDQAGFWDYVDTSCMNGPGTFQVDLMTAPGFFGLSTSPVFTTGPRKMVLDREHGAPATYAIDQ